jgi:hypothetical protein
MIKTLLSYDPYVNPLDPAKTPLLSPLPCIASRVTTKVEGAQTPHPIQLALLFGSAVSCDGGCAWVAFVRRVP